MKYILKISIFIVCLSFCSFIHKYYVSLTEINYNKKHESVEIITNVFIDDIETSINNEFSVASQIATPKEISNINSYFEKYLRKHIHITINGVKKTFRFIGKEYDGDLVFFYLEITNVSNINTFEIENTLLLNEFKYQKNLLKLQINQQKKSLFFDNKKTKELLKF